MKKLPLIPMKTRIAEIRSVYASAAERIIAALSSLEPESYTAVKSGAVLSQVKEIIGELDAAVQAWAPGAIRAAYEESAGVARTRLEMIGAKTLPANKYNPARHDKKIAMLTKTVMTDYWKANRTIERTARKYLAVVGQAAAGVTKLAQVQMFEAEDALPWIKRLLKKARPADVSMATAASGTVSRQIRDYLIKKIGGGDFINIRGRNYSLKAYSELVARTRMREAQTEATKELCKEFANDLVQFSKHDNPCEECAKYEGEVYSISGDSNEYDQLPEEAEPPVHPNCLLPGTRCIAPGGIIAGHRAFYRGQAIELSFSNGTRLSVTPNHMLLTPFGFAAAKFICQGDDVFYCPDFERIIATHPDEDNRPTLIENVVRALAKATSVSSASVPVAPEYLHGDGRFCDGDIDVIWADGLLENARQALVFQERGKNSFDSRRVALFNLFPLGALTEIFHRAAHSADSIVSGGRTSSPVFLARAGGGDVVGFADGPKGNGSLHEPSMDILISDFEPLRQITFEKPGLIQTTQVVNVRRFEFTGHVYDLQSPSSLYLGNGVLSSNCEHNLNPTSENALAWRNA